MNSPEILLGGWGVAPESRVDPAPAGRARLVLPPGAESLERALASPPGTPLLGWSLGAHLLLRALAEGDARLTGRRLTLVCPFVAFPAEAGAGGRVPLTAVKYLRKWLRRDPLAALTDFHRRAGLATPPVTALPYAADTLDAGFAWLESTVSPGLPGAPVAGLTIWLGGRDPLLDAERLAALLPGARTLPEAGHDIRDFAAVL